MVLPSQGGHHHGQELLEIIGIHMQLLGVQHTQLSVGLLDVVHVLHGPLQTAQHHLSVICHHWVGDDGCGVVEVSKSAEIPLSPGVDHQTPGRSRHGQKEQQDPQHHSRSWRRCPGWWRAQSLSIQPFCRF
uniref:Uncharacterized protein n=1 Tax=Echeneis naucrates TaxID=173247 RepID=A0A665V9A6_ECHNA